LCLDVVSKQALKAIDVDHNYAKRRHDNGKQHRSRIRHVALFENGWILHLKVKPF